MGRAAARLDPRLPDGRAGDHLLRPRPAEGVPRRAGGHRRRDPRRPRRRRDHRRRRPRPGAGAGDHAGRLRVGQPAQVPACSSTTSRAWFTEHPLYDAEGQPIVVPEWSFPGRGRVQGQLTRAKTVIARGERVLQPLPLRGKQAEWSATLEETQGRGRAGARVRRAVRPLHRVRGDLLGRQPAGDVGRPRRRRPGDVLLRPPRHRLADVHQRDPPAVARASTRVPRPTPRRRTTDRDGPAAPPGARPPTATSPRSTSRTR